MGNSLSNQVTDAASSINTNRRGLRSPPVGTYNGAQPSGTESARREETEPTIRGYLTTPTNVSSLVSGPSAPTTPSASPTTLESTLETITKQPTSQLNETDVTLNLFSPATPEPTIIPETPTIYETPMDYPPASPSAQALSGHSSLERKTRKDSPTYRRRHYVHSRLEDETGVTPRPTIFEESDDEKDEEPTVVCSLSRSGLEKRRIRSRNRRTRQEDPSLRRRKKTGSRKVRIQAPSSSDESSSSAEDYVETSQPTRLMKPPKYDGTSAFETFYAQFLNCSIYNRWTKTDRLAHLKGALQKEAGQVLWDYGPEVTNSFKELVRTLKGRFGGANQSDKFRMEIRNRRRKDGESLQSLHTDVRRLAALAFPDLEHSAREVIACDYFIDALADADFALKVRERAPTNLDSALRTALQLEVWSKEVARQPTTSQQRKVREVAKADDETAALKKQVADLQKQLAKLSQQMTGTAAPSTEGQPTAQLAGPVPMKRNVFNKTQPTRRTLMCFNCGDPNHFARNCPYPPTELSSIPSAGRNNARVQPIQNRMSPTNIMVRYKKHRLSALIDTGSDITIANADFAKKYRWAVHPCELKEVKAANGEVIIIVGRAKEYLTVGKQTQVFDIYISPDINGLIIGHDWLSQQGRLEWDFTDDKIQLGNGIGWLKLHDDAKSRCRRIYVEVDVELPPKQETIVPVRVSHRNRRDFPFTGVTESLKIPNLAKVYSGRSVLPARFTDLQICVANTANRRQKLKKGTHLGTIEPADIVGPAQPEPTVVKVVSSKPTAGLMETPTKQVVESIMQSLPTELTEEQRQQARRLIERNESIFSKSEYDIGRTHLVEHHIDTGSHRPIRQPLRRHPFRHLEIIDQQVDEMERHGIIEPAASPWASNVVLVRKKDGSLRFCVDYRRLNAITYKDSYPLPLIDNCLNALAGASWFSTVDLRSGYYNIPIADEDRDKSAFITRKGCHRFTVMPFGLTCAPSVFQRLMDFVLSGLSYITCLVYLDDIIIFGRTFEEQLSRLEEVFDRISSANLKLKPTKCSFFQRQVAFLGHIISGEGISVQESKVDAVRDWPTCRTLTELRAFLGTSGYYRRFVKNFSSIAAPLFALMKKGIEFVWTDECQTAFETLKSRLTSAPILALPTDEGTYTLDTDASDYGLGAVLSQKQDGVERVIAYASRTMTKSERHYETTRKELLAVIFGLKQFRQYLLGRHFVIRTDHAALSWLRKTPEPMPQLARWLTLIEQFDYEVVHRHGKQHANADGLSRRPTITDDQGSRLTQCQNESEVSSSMDNRRSHLATAEESSQSLQSDSIVQLTIPSTDDRQSSAQTNYTRPKVCVVESEAEVVHLLVRENLANDQYADAELGRVVQLRLETDECPSNERIQAESELTKKMVVKWENLEVHNGLVYRRFNRSKSSMPTTLQLLVPRCCVPEVFRLCHTGTVGGHFGVKRTMDQVQRRFYWATWKTDVRKYCKECSECSTYHRGKLGRQGRLNPVLAGAPYERWYIDLTGPHPKSDRGHVYILTCIDSFTKWAEAFPLRNKEAETIARVLVEQVFTRFGMPLSVLSDQGKEVDGRIMHEICRLFGIEKLRTSAYKPSTNIVERFHRTMNTVLAKMVSGHQKDWDSRLPFAMAAYRASRHDSTGYSPNFLTLGREVYGAVDIMYGNADETDAPTIGYDDFVEQTRSRMTTAYAEVREALKRSAERNKRYYDCKVRPAKFVVGQWVYYFNPRKLAGKQMKWIHQYVGPYLVVRIPSAVTVEIQKGPKARPFVVHIDKVKPFTGTPPTGWIVSSPGTADVPNVADHHPDTAGTEETESANSRLRHRLEIEDEPTSPLTPTEVYDADEKPVRTRPRRTIRRPKRFDY